MKRNIIVTLQTTTLKLDMDIAEESKYVLMNYGPVRAGLTTLQATLDPQLSELLRCLESKVKNLQSKSCTDSDISSTGTPTLRALHSTTTTERIGTDDINW